ncbi:hypothetical protein [Blastococcus haudaquaticus]|uniref:ABC-2 type transport system permease protein n=1 Tax=Blastococcus haudaquaticus TaxID=1938745 RepID=A0A286H500_9ACTN|nr:hypothetical protein [Blastococcus haudaquaticus]SOE02762.1 hypothetical protein SAMN06272739_3721 [Blastococcus haudaquaticus]
MNRITVMARSTAVELLRRRTVVALMVLVPLAFYAARHDLTGQSIRFLAIGLAWALSTLSAFAGIAGQAIDPRLRLSGYRAGELLAGRLLGLLGLAVALTGFYAAVIMVDRRPERWPGLLLALGLTVAVALPFGLLVAALLRRPLEAAMLLLVVSGLQMMMDPAGSASRVLPFWSVREILTWTVDGTDLGYLQRGLVHGALTVVLLGAATAALRARALRGSRGSVLVQAEPTG